LPTRRISQQYRRLRHSTRQRRAHFTRLGREPTRRALFEIAHSRAADSAEALTKYQQLLKELGPREVALSEREAHLEERQQSLDHQQGQLLRARERLAQREADAEAGFRKQHLGSIQALERETAALRAERIAARDQLAAEYERLDAEYRERRAVQEAELAKRRTALEEDLQSKQDALQSEQRELLRQKRHLDAERELLDEDRAQLETLVERRAARHVERLTADLSATQEQLAQARADRDESEVRLRAREEADRRFGSRTPEAVLEELTQLRRTNEALANELAERPNAEIANRVTELEAQRDAWEQERAALKARTGELEIQLRRHKVAAWEIETLRDQTEALESQRQLLRQVVVELRSDIREYAEQDDGNLPFPACSGMDELPELQTSPRVVEEVNDLATFADELRHRIAYDPATGKNLYYAEQDIRAFIGGLAMSKLHILEGISGTGKTSLPMAFARAAGAGFTLVEVQAGWRDRDDLVGHYNAFQNRFQESKLLRALYEAQCPQYAKSPYVVLLDEMNLSRPEQYFADFLSALEVDEHLRELSLMPVGVPRAPKLLVDGRKLCIPPNVWFIGTANHDETTVEFADKTYDRAWVLELPRQNKSFNVRQTPTAPPPLG
jgi:AAA domain (dynein-related subfamily)